MVFSVSTAVVCSETGQLCKGAASGDWDLWEKLRLLAVGATAVVASLPAGRSTVSTSSEVGGEAALPIAGEAAGGSTSFGEGSGGSEE